MVSITHKYVSANGDPPDSSLIGQTKWNDDHNVVGLTPGVDIQAYSVNLDSWSLVAPGSYLTVSAAASGYQPLDSDLTAISALAPSNDDVIQRKAGAWVSRTMAQLISDLAALATTFQPLASALTSWASVSRASGFDTFAATPSSANLRSLLTDETGTGAAVFANTPTLVSPVLGTPTSGNLANCTAYPLAQLSGSGTGVLTALGVNVGSAGAFVVFNGALGTPSGGTLTNCSGLPVSGISASTSTSIGVGSVELGHASDTTLSRASAGRLAVEGVNVVTVSSTDTLTNKTLTDPIVGTQTALDNSTKAASTAYVDRTTRQVLTANQTYYVRTDGSDSNNGLSNTSGGAFLTIQKAIDVVAALDLSIYDATIKCGAGTRTAPLVFKRTLGAGTASLEGDVTTPSNCTLSTTNVPCVQMTTGAAWKMRGFKYVVATSTYSISCEAANCDLTIDDKVEFGATPSYHVVVGAKGAIRFLAPYTISSGATNHIFALTSGFCYYTPGTVTLTGSPAFTSFVAVTSLALLTTGSTTFSGTVTGKRYDIALNGVINTFGGGANYFPGNAAGTTATGGQYA